MCLLFKITVLTWSALISGIQEGWKWMLHKVYPSKCSRSWPGLFVMSLRIRGQEQEGQTHGALHWESWRCIERREETHTTGQWITVMSLKKKKKKKSESWLAQTAAWRMRSSQLPCDSTSEESCGFRVRVAAANDLESRAQRGTCAWSL